MPKQSGLLNYRGEPLPTSLAPAVGVTTLNNFAAGDKPKPPRTGRAFGAWDADDPLGYNLMPKLNSLVQFDLDLLTMDDYRVMRHHPQVNSSISTLTFMQHQSPWEIECDDEKIKTFIDDNIRENWTTLNRSMAQANWAGYSPGVIEWENDVQNKAVVLHKIMDLNPSMCEVEWKQVSGAKQGDSIAPKYNIYNGIKQLGQPHPIPVENTFWYPLLMENGNYYGRKLLKAAFTPWYFSILIHLYANRYHERFGEPIPVGRAPFDNQEVLTIPTASGNISMTAHDYMYQAMEGMRNRSRIVLPSEGQQDSSGKFRYDYVLEFIDSQMRGADFDRYLNRLDEEITLALFTPVLLMRTADVGSYNLGTSHMQVYLWMMNAMNADRKQYIDRYLIRPLVEYNFGVNAKPCKIKFRQLGQQDADVIKAIVTGMFNSGSAKVDVKELGALIGLTVEEVDTTLQTPEQQAAAVTPAAAGKAADNAAGTADKKAKAASNASHDSLIGTADSKFWSYDNIVTRMAERLAPRVEKVYRSKDWTKQLDFGYNQQLIAAMREQEIENPGECADIFYQCLTEWSDIMLTNHVYENADEYVDAFSDFASRLLEARIGKQ